jgi:hypothetical protein
MAVRARCRAVIDDPTAAPEDRHHMQVRALLCTTCKCVPSSAPHASACPPLGTPGSSAGGVARPLARLCCQAGHAPAAYSTTPSMRVDSG